MKHFQIFTDFFPFALSIIHIVNYVFIKKSFEELLTMLSVFAVCFNNSQRILFFTTRCHILFLLCCSFNSNHKHKNLASINCFSPGSKHLTFIFHGYFKAYFFAGQHYVLLNSRDQVNMQKIDFSVSIFTDDNIQEQ